MWQEVIQASAGGGDSGSMYIKYYPDYDNRASASTSATVEISYEYEPAVFIVTAEAYTTGGTRQTAYDTGLAWVSDYQSRQLCRSGASFTHVAVPSNSAAAYPTIPSWDRENKKITVRLANNANYARAVYHFRMYYTK